MNDGTKKVIGWGAVVGGVLITIAQVFHVAPAVPIPDWLGNILGVIAGAFHLI